MITVRELAMRIVKAPFSLFRSPATKTKVVSKWDLTPAEFDEVLKMEREEEELERQHLQELADLAREEGEIERGEV